MADLTKLREYRSATTPSYWIAANHADMLAASGSSTLSLRPEPGDIVKVVTSGVTYVCISPFEFQAVSDERVSTKSWHTNFRDLTGEAVADTDAAVIIASSGLRIHGQGIEVADSGAVATAGAGGPVMKLTTTDEAAHTLVLSFGTDTEAWDPTADGPLVVEAVVSMDTALTDRAFFLGFASALADALDPLATGSATTVTLVADNFAGLYYDSGLTDADRLYLISNNADGAASLETTDDGVDTGEDFPAVGTYVRLRVEITAAGNVIGYVNGVKVAERALGVAAATDLNPVLYIESNAAATKSMNVKEFWAASLA